MKISTEGRFVSNRFFVTLLVLISIVFGIFVFTKNKHDSGNNTGSSSLPTEHIQGSKSSGVVLIEYGDFQCPACKQYFPIVEQVVEKYKDQIEFQFRNFPLVQIHQNAFAAHRGAQAADKQGKFWEMYRLLYEGQDSWVSSGNPMTVFEEYAKQLNLNLEQFKTDAASQETNDKINADIAEGKKLNISGTPGFVLNGKLLDENPRSLEEFEKLIDEAIKTKKTTPQ